MILITGATGHFGKATIDSLLKKGVPANTIAALVRDEAKAADLKAKGIIIRKGDYNDYASLVKAFTGVDKLLLVSGNELAQRGEQQVSAVKAATEAGVKHILYTSFLRKDESAQSPIAFVSLSHLSTEAAIKASGIPYTILQNSLYADVLPMFMGEKVLQTGIFFPAAEGRTSFATRADMAEATANILTSEGHANKEYAIANTVNYSLQDAAAYLSELSGKEITFFSPSQEVYAETLTKAGVPAEYIGLFAGFSAAIAQGEFDATTADLEKLLGRKPTTLKDYFKATYFLAH